MIGLASGFQDPICMVDGSAYDPDKAYKDSKLVSRWIRIIKEKRKINSI